MRTAACVVMCMVALFNFIINIFVVFIPPNTTALVQSLDQIIANVNTAYTRKTFALLSATIDTQDTTVEEHALATLATPHWCPRSLVVTLTMILYPSCRILEQCPSLSFGNSLGKRPEPIRMICIESLPLIMQF